MMPLWLQHLLVFALVAACLAVVGRQLVGTFRMTRGAKLGSCCAKGCEAEQSTDAAATPKPERIVFIPSSTLTRRSS
jgi:hypothetical protein